jgi:hypothetical protein
MGRVDGTSIGVDVLLKNLEAYVAWGADDGAQDRRWRRSWSITVPQSVVILGTAKSEVALL